MADLSGYVAISKKLYFNLKLDSEKLNRLECGGVDNWEWYGEAMHPDDQPDFDDFEENLKKEIESMKEIINV